MFIQNMLINTVMKHIHVNIHAFYFTKCAWNVVSDSFLPMYLVFFATCNIRNGLMEFANGLND